MLGTSHITDIQKRKIIHDEGDDAYYYRYYGVDGDL